MFVRVLEIGHKAWAVVINLLSKLLHKRMLLVLLDGNLVLLMLGFFWTVIAKIEIYSSLLEYLFHSFRPTWEGIFLYPGNLHDLSFLLRSDAIVFLMLLTAYLCIKTLIGNSRWFDRCFYLVSGVYAFLAFVNQKWVTESGVLLDFGSLIFSLQQAADTTVVVKEYISTPFLLGCVTIGTLIFYSFFQKYQWGKHDVSHIAKGILATSFVFSTILLFSYDAVKANDAGLFHSQLLRNANSVHLEFAKDAANHPFRPTVKKTGTKTDQSEEITMLERKPNIILISLESTRYKSTPFVSTEGIKDFADMPFLLSLAKNGALIKNVRTPVPHTSKALVASLSGHTPVVSSYLAETELHFPITGLPEYLQKFGYQSAFFQSPLGYFERRPALVHNLGFNHFKTVPELYPDTDLIGYFNADDHLMVDPAIEWVSQQKGPFVLTLLTSITHHPYMLPEEYSKEKWHEFQTNMGAVEKLKLYQKSLQYSDGFLRKFMSEIEQMGLLENTIVVIFGDHGEGFGEKGIFTHSQNPYEEVLRIPVILYGKGLIEPGQEIEGFYSSIDIVPTVLRLLGASNIPAEIEGVDMLSPAPKRKLFFSTWFDKSVSGVVDENGIKFIYDPRSNVFEVYDLKTDPWEKENLYQKLRKEDFDFDKMTEEIITWKTEHYDQGYDHDRNEVKKISDWQCKATGSGACFYGDKPGKTPAPIIIEE